MVSTDALRAKSLHAELAYLDDLRRVRSIKTQAEQRFGVVKDLERAFWHETTHSRSGVRTTRPASVTVRIETERLERMWRAHAQFKHAHAEHQSSTRQLRESLDMLTRSEQCREAVQAMLDQTRRKLRIRSAGQQADELTELATATQLVGSLHRRSKGQETADQVAEGGLPPGEVRPSRVGISHVSIPLSAVRAETQLPVGESIRLAEPACIDVQQAVFHHTPEAASLSIVCAVGRYGPLALSLTKADGAGIRVVVDSSMGSLAATLASDKGVLQARLNARGIRVASVEIGQPEGAGAGTWRPQRRTRGAKDEERIT